MPGSGVDAGEWFVVEGLWGEDMMAEDKVAQAGKAVDCGGHGD